MSGTPRQQVLVSPAELAAELGGESPPVVLDVRWQLMDPAGAGRERYAAAHLPGARFLDLESVLTLHTGDPLDGRHPLPDPATLEAGLGALGVRADDDLVVYDEARSYAAERAWWVLRWAGLTVRVLDGGLAGWSAAGGEVEAGPGPAVTPTSPTLTTGHLPTLTADETAAAARSGLLLDARAPERYHGEVEPLDSRAGHVPGALNLPASGLYAADGTLLGEADLHAALAAAGVVAGVDAAGPDGDVPPVATYCGSGVSAARNVLALATLGITAPLFPGSWSAWSSDPGRPAATGGSPG